VQFYQADTFLTESVTSFLTEGLQVNDTIIVVATAQHCEERLKIYTAPPSWPSAYARGSDSNPVLGHVHYRLDRTLWFRSGWGTS
jgi:hypothetical protein